MTVHISQFYNCDRITTGAELYLVCELGKYIKNRGDILSLDGVILDKALVNSRYWHYYSYAVENSFITLGVFADTSMTLYPVDLIDFSRFFINDLENSATKPIFKEKNSDIWVWSKVGRNSSDEIANIKAMVGTNRNQALISLIAMVMVNKFFTDVPKSLEIELDADFVSLSDATALYYIILQNTNVFSGDWIKLSMPNVRDAYYNAWVYDNIDAGVSKRSISIVEKKNYFKEHDFQVGDVVLLYKRGAKDKSLYMPINECCIAVIFNVSDSYITFNKISTSETDLTMRKRIASYDEKVRKLYPAVTNVRVAKENFQWMDIGLGRQTYLENVFMLPLTVRDTSVQWVERTIDGVREEQQVVLDSVNAIYWILKDRGIEFNEEHFKALYSPNGDLKYDIYMNGGEI